MINDLCAFIDASPSPAHAAATLEARLSAAGFQALLLTESIWQLAPGSWYVRQGASVIAFVIRSPAVRRFAVIGAHTDSPHLRLKPNAAFACEHCRQLGVEVYGGVLLNSWLDRDLGLAGTVHTVDGRALPVLLRKPLARVPQLAIHLDRTVNEQGVKLNPQTQLSPIWGLDGTLAPADAFADLLANAAGVPVDQLLSHDLSLFDVTPSTLGGADGELVFAARLDNLASVHAGLCALLAARDGIHDTVPVLACFDHEEVGSSSRDGAAGSLLSTVLERLALSLGLARQAYLAALARSLMLSADMAHAVHPNYHDRHEPRHKPYLGGGPVLKSNANQRYATSAASAAEVRRLAREAGVTLQDFISRNDLGCGSTIGPFVAAALGMAVADLGNPMLSMHSARECAASADHEPYVRLLAAHLRS
jgi:aspartyl aminopeptidase